MNKEELKQIIRSIVREEVERALPNVLVEILTSKVGDREMVTEVAQAPIQRRPVAAAPRPQQKFSSNPILNQVLNDTRGGVPADPEAEMVSAEMPVAGAQVSVLDKIRSIPKAQLAENKEVAGVLNVLNRDFRQTVRAIDKSAGRVPAPNFKMQPGMFDDAV
jgi:hypothetical protein